jgi:hypothetical protein
MATKKKPVNKKKVLIKKKSLRKLSSKKVVKKLKVVKKPLRPVCVCILTGQTFKISKAQLEARSLKLKFPSSSDYVQYYVCKEAIKLLKEGYTEYEIRNKFNCKDKTDLPLKFLRCYAPKIKDREKVKRRKEKKLTNSFIEDFMSDSAVRAKYAVNRDKVPTFLNMKNAKDVESLTHSSCHRPHIFLNNGKNCEGCSIFKLCKCPIKKINEKRTNKSTSI